MESRDLKLIADGRAWRVDGRAQALVGPGLATPLILPEPTLVSSPTQSGPTTASDSTESRNDPITANSDSSSAAQSGSQ